MWNETRNTKQLNTITIVQFLSHAQCFFLSFFLSLSLSLSSLVIFLYEYTSTFTMNTKLRIDAAVDQTKNSTLLPMAHSTTVSSVTPISDIFYYSIPHLSQRAETSLSYTSPLPLLSLRSLTFPSKNRTHPRSRTSHKYTPSQRSRCKTSSQTLSWSLPKFYKSIRIKVEQRVHNSFKNDALRSCSHLLGWFVKSDTSCCRFFQKERSGLNTGF